MGPKDGLAGNHAAGDGNLNYAKGDRFTTPFKLITDLEYKKGRFGGLIRAKAWYDQALNSEKVLRRQPGQQLQRRAPAAWVPFPATAVCTAGDSSAGAPLPDHVAAGTEPLAKRPAE